MAEVTVRVEIKNEQLEDDTFQVSAEVIDAVNISRYLFTYFTRTGQFNSVATVRDLRTYGISREEADEIGNSEYRDTRVVQAFSTVDDATNFETTLRFRIKSTTTNWQDYTNGFPDEEIVEFDGN